MLNENQMIHPGKPGDDGDPALGAALAAADEDMLSAISDGLDLDIGLARILKDLGGSPATRPSIQAQVPAWPGEDRGIRDTTISRNPSSLPQLPGPSGRAVRHGSRRTAPLLLWLALSAMALGAAIYFLFPLLSGAVGSAAYLILAVFLAGLVLGALAMVAAYARREAHGELPGAAPGAAGRRTRRLVGRLVGLSVSQDSALRPDDANRA
jgi:hypothetical protein